MGKAEAERMRMKAAAYKQYSDAAILALTLEALPKIAAEVSAPLAKTDQIVMIGSNSGNVPDALTQLVSQIPPTIQALTGINLTGALAKIPGAVVQNSIWRHILIVISIFVSMFDMCYVNLEESCITFVY